MTDLVMGGSLLKILNGAPIISINKINGEEIIKLIPFFIRLNICGERGIRTLDTLTGIPLFESGAFNLSAISPYLIVFILVPYTALV